MHIARMYKNPESDTFQTSFYSILGVPCLSERDLEFIPCSISYLGGDNTSENSEGGGCILVGGSNKRVSICNKEGVSEILL